MLDNAFNKILEWRSHSHLRLQCEDVVIVQMEREQPFRRRVRTYLDALTYEILDFGINVFGKLGSALG